MTATAHALVAGAIASKFSDPMTAGGLTFISHYLLDSVPHWDFGTNWRTRPKYITGVLAIFETLFGIGLSYVVFRASVPFSLWATTVFMSLLPDWLETPWYIFFAHPKKPEPGRGASLIEKISFQIYKKQSFFHAKAQLPLGILTQLVTIAFFLILLSQ